MIFNPLIRSSGVKGTLCTVRTRSSPTLPGHTGSCRDSPRVCQGEREQRKVTLISQTRVTYEGEFGRAASQSDLFHFDPEMRRAHTRADRGRGRTIETVEIPFLSQRHSKDSQWPESGPSPGIWLLLCALMSPVPNTSWDCDSSTNKLKTTWREMEKDTRRGRERKGDGKRERETGPQDVLFWLVLASPLPLKKYYSNSFRSSVFTLLVFHAHSLMFLLLICELCVAGYEQCFM